jgi:hypothetical protein
MLRRRSLHLRLWAASIAGLTVTAVVAPWAVAAVATDLPRDGVVITTATLTAKATTRVGVASIKVADDSRVASTGWLTVSNRGKKAATITVHEVEIVGSDQPIGIVGPDVPAAIVGPDRVAVVAPGQTSVLPVGIVGPDHPAGTWVTSALDVTSTGPADVSAGTLSVIGVPSAGSPLAYTSVTRTTETVVGAKGTLLLETKFDPAAEVDALGQGWVALRSSARKPTPVSVDYLMDGAPMGTVRGIVGPDRPLTLPVGLLCDGVVAGVHTFELRASADAAGVTASAATLGVLGLPTTGEMPHGEGVVGAAVPLGAKPSAVMHAELVATGGANDVWMGGWATVTNPSGKVATVTLQAQMGNDLEGPALVVSVPARTSISVPFGIQCNGEPAGLTSLDLTGTSNSSVTVTAGELQAWSLGSP